MKGGYRAEFVMLYGPDRASPNTPPDAPSWCEMMIMSNVAREAHYQRSSGRLKNFSGCTRWKPVHINKERLQRWAGDKALHRLLDLHTMSPIELRWMLDDGNLEGQLFSFSARTDSGNFRPRIRYVTLVLLFWLYRLLLPASITDKCRPHFRRSIRLCALMIPRNWSAISSWPCSCGIHRGGFDSYYRRPGGREGLVLPATS